jgi:hypothetical protein
MLKIDAQFGPGSSCRLSNDLKLAVAASLVEDGIAATAGLIKS